MFGPLIRDRAAAGASTRRKASSRGAVRVAPPVQRQPRLPRWRLPAFSGLGAKLQQVVWPLLLVGLGVGLFELGQRLLPLADRPIALVSVQGELQYIDQTSIQAVVQPYLTASFFGLDVHALRTDLAAMPWVADSTVQRVWPDQLVVHLEEQLPIARWGEGALLNSAGRTFAPDDLSGFIHLPQLNGPERSRERVLQQYQQFNRQLRDQGFGIAELELRERGSWFLTTREGIVISLGRERLNDKLERFLTVDQRLLSERRDQIARVDLRYSNAMAVAWRSPTSTTAGE
ncbi:cell division protein FtsQ/DivIB [Halopseudomonas salegens]|uniref:Cell division protein FtsQ n=1 Tax=Halopseudomonas salegens TaxID=1434072 RepID=A0A1H2GR32_9GAMM|nr:cell division protein FtsQ/DivIB [Halopseudomonas salegens]SDU22156.1 cell division protein FtsQ [Halopseudomonas salegens]